MALLMTDLLGQVRAEMTALGIFNPNERAFFLAMTRQESSSTADRARATELAEVHHNVFGVHWVGPRDQKYGCVIYGANLYDAAKRVKYRIYSSLRECINIERINKILRPGLYLEPKRLYGNGYPSAGSRPDWPHWIDAMMWIHCNENPQHAQQVRELWLHFRDQEIQA